jgi:hypothetical protein
VPTLFQIASYSRLFQLLRGRKPTFHEVRRYFDGDAPDYRVRSGKRKRCHAGVVLSRS